MSSRILVVDDMEPNRKLLKDQLESRYHHVDLAVDGVDALEKVAACEPEIILLDVMMPRMDGFETCRRLKADPRTLHIPVVMVTALSDPESRKRGLEAGAEDFLSKPIDSGMLFSRITALARFNAVAGELRQRDASAVMGGKLDPHEMDAVQEPARVFVVDADPKTAARSAAILREAGHSAWTLAEAGSASLASAASQGVDVLMVALSRQAHDPLRLCAHFRTNPATRGLGLLVTFERQDAALAQRALEVGASDLIVEPLDAQELLARVRTQVRRTRYVDILRRRVDRGLELSVTDQLTGLYNRRYMDTQLEQWMRRTAMGGQALSVLSVDVDRFKSVNDRYGHAAGDEVLVELAARLRANTRPNDIVCRPGGEEFLVIMPDTAGDLACAAAERVRRAVAAQPFAIEAVPEGLTVTVSGGVSTSEGAGDSAAALIARSDKALYEAKRSGRNRVMNRAA